MFDLVKPCVNCPFRKGQGELFQLRYGRLVEIINAEAFQCHKTVDYSGENSSTGDKPQQCAGLMAILARSNQLNTIMQVGERLGYLKLEKLDPDNEAYQSIEEAIKAHQK